LACRLADGDRHVGAGNEQADRGWQSTHRLISTQARSLAGTKFDVGFVRGLRLSGRQADRVKHAGRAREEVRARQTAGRGMNEAGAGRRRQAGNHRLQAGRGCHAG
jgi:hypothetical protein